MTTLNRKTWLLAAALLVVGARAQAADWGLVSIPPMESRPNARVTETIVRGGGKAERDCDVNPVRAPQRLSGKILKVAQAAAPTKPAKPTMEERIAESDRIAAQGGNRSADRLAQAAFAAAAKCRDFARFKKARMGLKQGVTYNSCRFFGAQNAYRSKGLCSAGVREAFAEVGIRLSPGAAKDQRPTLKANGFKPVAYNPWSAKNGTVLVCNGGHSECGTKKNHVGCGHIETVVIRNGQRNFCSDFCSTAPTCSRTALGYSNLTAFELSGI